MKLRCAVSCVVAGILFLAYFEPFRSYSQRSQLSRAWWPFPLTALICGVLLTLGLSKWRYAPPTSFLLTLLTANVVLISVDIAMQAADHDLFPIELLFVAVLASPVYLGALISVAVERLWHRNLKPSRRSA